MTHEIIGPITLTSNASGTVTVIQPKVFGVLHEVIVVPSSDVLSNAWDIEITRAGTNVPETLFQTYTLNTYTQGNMYFYPRVQIVTQLGVAPTANTNINDKAVCGGDVQIKGINMGNVRTAYVYLVVEK